MSDSYSLSQSEIEKISSEVRKHHSSQESFLVGRFPGGLQSSALRLVDCAVSFVAIIAALPIMVMVCLALRIECRDSALVVSWIRLPMRAPIAVLKFRTRRASPPREFTRIGSFLAVTRLDRMPYLFSVFNGDLSLLGTASLLFGAPERYECPKAELPFSLYSRLFKRMVDILFVLLASPMILLVIGTLYVVVRSDGGSGFFGQKRVGQHGNEFSCWKIRTMQTNAAEMLKKHLADNPEAAKEWEENRKLADDPRITRIGKILRKTSLDEFPQFWNVLKGEMSIVGPRPVPADELRKYGEMDVFYKAVRPGITGLWQVSGRNDISYEERVSLDRTYTKSISFIGDMIIIMKTVDAMLKRTGG
ncbi:sugar transferase [Roseibium sp.]|uniref:sugar transferase n=1 Tax=Roseibium sp. TaxID=1936156 RepID=UPI003B50804D